MKKFTLIFAVIIASMFTFGQSNEVEFSTVKKIADHTAQSVWGDVSNGGVFPLYSKDDEIIAYRFNFSFDKPFPDEETLIKKCEAYYEKGDKDSQWGVGEYGYIMVSARTDMDVIQSYSDVLSPEYAEGFKMRNLAMEKLGSNVSLKKVYYINFENQWFCFTNGTDDVYVKVFPRSQAVNEMEFHGIVDDMAFFCETGNFSSIWDQYISGNVLAGKSQVWIPNHDGYCKFYDYSYGCTPTAAAMLVSWWDYNSINSTDKFSKLIDYHFERGDEIQGEIDYQVPNAQKELAIAMNTDTLAGSTDVENISSGLEYFLNTVNNYNFSCPNYGFQSSTWNFNKIQSEIGTYQRPIQIGIYEHSECCVAYDVAASEIGVHNTYVGSVEWISYTQVLRVYPAIPGGANGAAINLENPLGDTGYNSNGLGGNYYGGHPIEITWNSDYYSGSYIKISYSLNGGYNWTTITNNTENDGVYDWLIPISLESSKCRILIEQYDYNNNLLGADGSFGNFAIYANGQIDYLSPNNINTFTLSPSYRLYIQIQQKWCAVGVRNITLGDDWDIYHYDDNTFTNIVASSLYGGSTVDFVVMNGHYAPSQDRGIKLKRYSGSTTGFAKVEYDSGSEPLSTGNNLCGWTGGNVVEMHDVYLESGTYEFDLEISNGYTDLGFAIYSSTPSSYYAGRSSNLAISDNAGAGGYESFTVTVANPDYYGVCVWANDDESCDYNINIKSAGTWTGAINNDWHNPGNWVAGIVPDATMDVRIPNVTNKCWMYGSNAACKSLTIEEGAGNYFRIYDNSLHIYGDLTIYAELMMDNSSGSIIVDGNVYWNNNSTAYFTASTVFTVSGNWFFNTGSNAQLANGMVYFTGAGNSEIKCKSPSSFNSIYLDKGGSGTVTLSYDSNNPLVVNDDIYIQPGTSFTNHYNQDIICGGDLWNSGEFNFSYGTNSNSFILNGSAQTINMGSPNGFFDNLVINPVSSLTLNGDIHIANNITIESGSFIPQAHYVYLGGNWTNNTGPSAFVEDDSWVVFEGAGSQYVYGDEHFDKIDITGGGFLTVDDPATDVVCNFYQWSMGGIDVISGSFTANDLANNGLYGTYECSAGGIINLYQDQNQYIDLNGTIKIYGGTMTVYGGLGASWWPYQGNAVIEMTDGILDFPDNPIRISPSSYSFTEIITGGTIRTAWSFDELRGDFTPEGGTVELYGNNNSHITQTTGSNYYNLRVDKSLSDNFTSKNQNNIVEYRDGTKEIITKGITVTADSNLVIHHNFIIDAGIFDAPEIMEIGGPDGGDWVNNVTPEVFLEGTGTVIFKGEGYQHCFSEDFYNLQINQQSWGYLLVESGQAVTCQSYRWINGGIAVGDGTFTANDLFDNGIYGNFFVNGSNGVINLYQDPSGWVDLNGSIIIYDGEMNIYGGTDYSYWPLTTDVNLTMTGGVLNFENDFGIFLNGGSSYTLVTNITGGTIRTTGGFYGNSSDFKPTDGTVELYGPNDIIVGIDGGSYFHNLLINKTAPKDENSYPLTLTDRNGNVTEVTLSQKATSDRSFIVNGDLIINSGMFLTDLECITVGQNVEINDGATYYLGYYGIEGASLMLNNNSILNVNNGGSIILDGGGGYEAIVSHTTGYYEFNVNAGGTISADTAIFEYMGTSYGINIKDGATVYPDNCFNFCEFKNGDPSITNGALLTVNNDQDLTIENSFFPSTGTAYNVRKDLDKGSVFFKDYSGAFSGEDYDYDPYNRIDWFVPEFSVDPWSISVGPIADTVQLIIASNTNWELAITYSDYGWISLSSYSGTGNDTVKVFINENPNTNPPRYGQIKAIPEGLPEGYISVEQEGIELYAVPLSFSVAKEAGTESLIIYSNTYWTIYASGSWLSLSALSGFCDDTIVINYEENTEFISREAHIYIEINGSIFETVTFYQEASEPELFVTPSERNVSAAAGTTSFFVFSNTNWYINSIPNWCQISYSNGYGDDTLIVTYQENTSLTLRTGEIMVYESFFGWSVTVTINQEGVGAFNLDLTVFLEGPFNTTSNLMETNLNSLLPAAQPFNSALPYYGNPMPDWYYTGAENSPVPNGYVVDWILVDLRDAASATTATPATSFKQIAAFLLNTGQIVGLDGSSVLSFSHSFLNSLYVAVWHRNHLGVLAANALSRTGNTYSYDFSTGSGQAYGGTSAQKLLGGGKWGMMSGDGNGDGDITIDDINNAWKTEAGTKGYLGGDFNMNTQVENSDKNDGVIENLGSSSQVPD
jgi:hypothetical protein